MRSVYACLVAGLVWVLTGCVSAPVALAPVGPNPVGNPTTGSTGELQVFSSVVEQSDDQNQATDDEPVWYQHTDYRIYNLQGKLLKHVDNTIGHYDQAPRPVTLSAGQYLIRAQSKDYLWVVLPVTIQAGRTTQVHLDDKWKLPPDTPENELVCLPNGKPVGWRADSTNDTGIN